MAVKFRKQVIKFLEKANPEELESIRDQIKQIIIAVEEQGIIPFTELDIKKIKCNWKGFYRLRVGKNRVILSSWETTSFQVTIIKRYFFIDTGRKLNDYSSNYRMG